MLRVYTASKISTAPLWHELHRKWPEVYFHARWLKHNIIGTANTDENARKFWQEDEEDIKSADILMIYAATADEHLRGALVEAGIAIAYGIPVLVVGNHKDYGTWQFHPLCFRVFDLIEAHLFLTERLRIINRLQN